MGDSFEAKLPLAALGLSVGQKIGVSGFQEGASDGWATDWMESAEITLTPPGSGSDVDLSQGVFVDGYGFTVILEDGEGGTVDPDGVTATLDEEAVDVTATKEDGITTVTGVFNDWLSPGAQHAFRLSYEGGHGGSSSRVGLCGYPIDLWLEES